MQSIDTLWTPLFIFISSIMATDAKEVDGMYRYGLFAVGGSAILEEYGSTRYPTEG